MPSSDKQLDIHPTPFQPLTAEEFNAVKAACEKLLEKGQRLNLKAVVRNQISAERLLLRCLTSAAQS